jgi:hypothetical protein
MTTSSEQQETVNHLIEVRRLAAVELGKLGVHAPDGKTEEGVLRSELSQVNQLLMEVGSILGNTGPARTLPEFARTIMSKIPKTYEK